MVNIFSVISGKLFECQKPDIGKLFRCHSGKEIQCQVVNFFIDIHSIYGNDSFGFSPHLIPQLIYAIHTKIS